MPGVTWSERARRDLRAIDQYLSGENPAVAVRMLRAIRAKADQLHSYPESGPAFEGELRSLVVLGTPFIIVYRTVTGGVEILRVRHGREDWRGA